MKIGTVEVPSRLVLAPMAGVTDLAFRLICRELGAGLTVTEMVSAKAMTRAATACPTPRWDRFADVSFETDENLCFIPLAFPPKIIGQRPPRGKNEPG